LPSIPDTRVTIRRFQTQIAAWVSDEKANVTPVLCFIAAHIVLWTVILMQLKAAQDVHFDVAEAYAWGQKFLLGYGKHPPLSGWIAGLWFMVFPATDWATYALAMTVLGCGLMICWLIALRVVDHRRAFFTVVMLALYPIFNFKGFKYNADLLQLVTLPLVVLAYLDAFDKRTVRSGVWLGLAAAAALMTKYWALTMIGAVGLAALIHPARLLFLRSPAPWVAIATLVLAMVPHLVWLKQVDFLPLTYAADTYAISSRAQALGFALGYIGHNLALLALPVTLAAVALAWSPRWWVLLARKPVALVTQPRSRRVNPGVFEAQAINVWIIQIVVAIGPPLGALIFEIYIKTDWGIPLFFLTPLAFIAISALRVQRWALVRITAIWLILTIATLIASPFIAAKNFPERMDGFSTFSNRSDLARELTKLWHQRFHSRWMVVAGATDVGEPMTFYSPDHPKPLTPVEPSGGANVS
jgi:4-amino-4-deoxy-L-arabinose transferase-like glycosyltransferase